MFQIESPVIVTINSDQELARGPQWDRRHTEIRLLFDLDTYDFSLDKKPSTNHLKDFVWEQSGFCIFWRETCLSISLSLCHSDQEFNLLKWGVFNLRVFYLLNAPKRRCFRRRCCSLASRGPATCDFTAARRAALAVDGRWMWASKRIFVFVAVAL